MFYLDVFLKVIKAAKINTIVLTTLIVSLLGVSFFQKDIYLLVVGKDKKLMNASFKGVVYGNNDPVALRKRLVDIPGVTSVEWQRNDNLKSKITNNLEENHIKIPSLILDENFVVFDVFLSPNLSTKNMELVKKYFTKIVGIDNVVVSPLKLPSDKQAKDKEAIYTRILLSLKVFILIALVFSYYLFVTKLIFTSQLVEVYQRKKKVLWKSLITGFLVMTIALMFIFTLVGQFHPIVFVSFYAAIIALAYVFSLLPRKSLAGQSL